MPIPDLKARIHELLVAGFARRGFAYARLPRKDPNANRYSPFVRTVALASSSPAPTATWTITVDVRGVRRGQEGYVFLDLHCALRIDAAGDLLDDPSSVKGGAGTFYANPGGMTRGEAAVPHVDDGQDPQPSIDALFEIVDALLLPWLQKYSNLQSLVDDLMPPIHVARAERLARWVPAKPGDPIAPRDAVSAADTPWTLMALIAVAHLLEQLDTCETIAIRARANYADAEQGSVQEALADQLADGLRLFYERHLKGKVDGVRPEVWLGPA
jgi:hypothetical protein